MPEIKIPSPFLITVDDVGWWNGRDGSKENQPFRTGMTRRHVPEDYKALAALGKALDMRIPAGFVLCEWDGASLLKQLPSATWMGNQWQVPFSSEVQKEEAVEIIKNSVAYVEPALHGIGHEFWISGKMSRSEFHTSSGQMRQSDEVKRHLDYFFRLLEQNHLDSEIRLFIPPAMNYSFGDGENGFQKIAGSFGIQFVTLVFERARCRRLPQYGNVGWECGVVALDRGEAPISWNSISPDPGFNPAQAILPLHWANILHEKPEKNMDTVNAWVKEIDRKIEDYNLVPARDIARFLTQFLNMTRSKIQSRGNTVIVDMDWIHEVPGSVLTDSVFFSADPSSEVDISGTEKVPASTFREEKFIKVRLPESGKIVFQFY